MLPQAKSVVLCRGRTQLRKSNVGYFLPLRGQKITHERLNLTDKRKPSNKKKPPL